MEQSTRKGGASDLSPELAEAMIVANQQWDFDPG